MQSALNTKILSVHFTCSPPVFLPLTLNPVRAKHSTWPDQQSWRLQAFLSCSRQLFPVENNYISFHEIYPFRASLPMKAILSYPIIRNCDLIKVHSMSIEYAFSDLNRIEYVRKYGTANQKFNFFKRVLPYVYNLPIKNIRSAKVIIKWLSNKTTQSTDQANVSARHIFEIEGKQATTFALIKILEIIFMNRQCTLYPY